MGMGGVGCVKGPDEDVIWMQRAHQARALSENDLARNSGLPT
jgi:hypothetical protein